MEQKRALIVEDNADLLVLYTKAVESLAVEVDPVTNLANAIEMIKRNHYDVIITDMRLGGDHGTDLLRHLLEARTLNTEVVIVSGEDHYRQACMDLGFDLFISKPVLIRELRRLVERLLQPEMVVETQE